MTSAQKAVLDSKCALQLLPAYVCAEVLGCTSRSNSMFLRREGTLVPMLGKVELWPWAVSPVPVTGVIPSVHGLANPSGTTRASICKWGREHCSWLLSECWMRLMLILAQLGPNTCSRDKIDQTVNLEIKLILSV